MVDGDMKTESGSKVGEPGSPPGTGGQASTGQGAPMYDFKALPYQCLRILKDPSGSLEALYKAGKPALIQGLLIGGSVAILIPLIQLLFKKMNYGEGFSPEAGEILKQCLGGLVFLAVGVALSYLLKKPLGKASSADWQEDVYLFGSAMLFLLASVIVGGLLSFIHEKFFMILVSIVTTMGLLLTAFTYYWGLLKVAKADVGRGICVVVTALAGALLISALLNFSLGMGMDAFAQDFSRAIQQQMRGMENLFQGIGR